MEAVEFQSCAFLVRKRSGAVPSLAATITDGRGKDVAWRSASALPVIRSWVMGGCFVSTRYVVSAYLVGSQDSAFAVGERQVR